MNISSIIRRIAAVTLALLLGGNLVAQTTSKQINQIKRNPDYLYAEATMNSHTEAYDVASELLMQQVEEYIADKRKISSADNVLIKDIKAKSELLSMMRGEMHRVFVYVKKSDIEGVSNLTAINSATGVTVTIADASMASVHAASATQDVQTPLHQSTVPVAQDAQASLPQPMAAKSDPYSVASTTPAVANPIEDSSLVASLPNPLSGWQQQAMESLLACDDVVAVRACLSRLKSEYKVKRYGTVDSCPSVNGTFWAIFNADGKLVTILGSGASQRIDYRTMQYSSLDVYKGMNALWFNFAK